MPSFLRLLFGGQSPEAPPLTPPGFTGAVLPIEDEADAPENPSPALDSPIRGQAFVIEYVDANGFASERRIVADCVYQAGSHAYLSARCQERRATRNFRIDRITSVFCGAHGDDLGTPAALFIPTEQRAALGPNLKRPPPLSHRPIRWTVRALMSIARSDGHAHPGEIDVIRAYLTEVLPREAQSEIPEILQWADRLAADFRVFMDGHGAAFEHPNLTQPFLLAAAAIAAVDGRLDDRERELLEDLRWIAEAQGVRLPT
ncbi:MAG: TerB family tellurite resistance protein [Caulobacteraceae bacterium]|nr:TerB family tellurite resistance protein [Caulobacteraceae bacterium]